MKKISIVIPCMNEEKTIPLFHRQLLADTAAIQAEFELIFVDDGSTDGTLAAIKELVNANSSIRYLSFSRNFGKEAAILAGLDAATGDYVTIMDVDLQDPPSLLPDMLKGIETEGYDCVACRRVSRLGEPMLKSFCARLFYRLINRMTKTEIVDGARDYRLMTRQMVDAILQLRESGRFSKGLFSWVGFRTKWLAYENAARAAGETKWSFWKLFLYALDGIVSFTTVPLAIASIMGIFFCAVSFLLLLFFFVKTLVWGDPVTGFPALVCIITFLGGIQLFCIGVLGQYLAKVFTEVKHRPPYLIKEHN